MAIVPPATIGILGGGQLGRMTALAARSIGYQIRALDPDPQCSIRSVVERCVTASFDDVGAAASLARECDVVTLEIEKISVEALRSVENVVPLRPSSHILHLVQNRLRQKRWLQTHGFPVGPFAECSSAADFLAAAERFGSAFAKAVEGGYDGRGQAKLRSGAGGAAADLAWRELGSRPAIVEKALDLEYEISVLVARRPSGETVAYAPALNHHEDQILVWSVLPAPIPEAMSARAQNLAKELAAALQLEGILCVEMFVTKSGELLVNELAPRPHNSYHASSRACVTDQFEQLVRAVCDLPLGSPEIVRPAAIVNLLGDLWCSNLPPDLAGSQEIPGSRLHLYDKPNPRPGRKMGHLSAVGSTPEEAVARAQSAYARLSRRDRE